MRRLGTGFSECVWTRVAQRSQSLQLVWNPRPSRAVEMAGAAIDERTAMRSALRAAVRRDRRSRRCTHAQHGAAACDVEAERDADGERSEPEHERGVKRARG